jgi:hypothetical protein
LREFGNRAGEIDAADPHGNPIGGTRAKSRPTNAALFLTTCSGTHKAELIVRRNNTSAAATSRVRDSQQSSTCPA